MGKKKNFQKNACEVIFFEKKFPRQRKNHLGNEKIPPKQNLIYLGGEIMMKETALSYTKSIIHAE